MPTKLQPTPHLRQFIKPKVAAARLGVCTKTVMRMADAGAIHRYKLNARLVLFDEAEIAAMIEQSRC
jgi:predicted site-specific integrase-resolvase